MNIQRFVLPASIAATAHVALLWAIPRESWIRPVSVIAIPLPPLPPPENPVAAPPEEKKASTEPVRPLSGSPTPPEIMLPPPDRPRNVIPLPDETRPRKLDPGTTIIPIVYGPGNAGMGGPGEWNQREIFSGDQLDREPRATVQPPPEYPLGLRRSGVTGEAVVEFEVDTGGRVVRAEVVRCTHREFAAPAVRAVLQWRFEPGRREGRAVPFRLRIPIEFQVAAD